MIILLLTFIHYKQKMLFIPIPKCIFKTCTLECVNILSLFFIHLTILVIISPEYYNAISQNKFIAKFRCQLLE